MVQLETWQLGEFLALIFEAGSVVHSDGHEDCDQTNHTGGELVVFARDKIEDCRVEGGHEVGGGGDRTGGGEVLSQSREIRCKRAVLEVC